MFNATSCPTLLMMLANTAEIVMAAQKKIDSASRCKSIPDINEEETPNIQSELEQIMPREYPIRFKSKIKSQAPLMKKK